MDHQTPEDLREWARVHRDTGCYDCKYADGCYLGKGPCCQYQDWHDEKLSTDENGRCTVRVPHPPARPAKPEPL